MGLLGYIEESPENEKFVSHGVINKAKRPRHDGKSSAPPPPSTAALEGPAAVTGAICLVAVTAETGDEKVDRMVNIWNQYQCMVTFNMSRSASYFESGMGRGMGFRDSCQDLLRLRAY